MESKTRHDWGDGLQPSKRRGQESEENLWATSYSDLMTLLLVFFAVLVSASSVDSQKMRMIQMLMEGQAVERPRNEAVIEDLEVILNKYGLTGEVSLKQDEEGILMIMKDSLFFARGTAEISSQTTKTLQPILAALGDLPEYYQFKIEGHTDNVPIQTSRYPSNWYLSAARAIAIIELFQNQGIDRKRLSAHAFADTQPVELNQNSAGKALRDKQAMNRRVAIRIN